MDMATNVRTALYNEAVEANYTEIIGKVKENLYNNRPTCWLGFCPLVGVTKRLIGEGFDVIITHDEKNKPIAVIDYENANREGPGKLSIFENKDYEERCLAEGLENCACACTDIEVIESTPND